MSEITHLIIALLSILGSAFYSGLETGIVSINRLRLRHLVREKVKGADILTAFIENPDHLLGTMLVGNNLCNVLASISAVSLGTQLLGATGYSMAYVIITLTMLIFGEYLPKAWFQAAPAHRSLPLAKAIKLNGIIFYPASKIVTFLAKILVPVRTTANKINQPFITKEEIKYLTNEKDKGVTLSSDERRMIHGVFELTQKPCKEIMILKTNIIHISDQTPREEIIQIARTKKVSRLPVRQEESDQFIGIVYIFDVLKDTESKRALHIMRPPQFVSGDTPCDDLLPRMKLSRQPLALVTNQHSEVIGLITIEDLLLEIVGLK